MPDYKKIFPQPHALLVVIHAQDPDHAMENARIAHDEGVDGIFLINHRISSRVLLDCYMKVRGNYPLWWVGLNFLDQTNLAAINIIPFHASGLWVDDAKINEDKLDEVATEAASFFLRKRMEKGVGWRSLYFGGIAFKGQRPVQDVARIAKLAVPFVDVITTSGPGTGFPPALEKVQRIRKAIGNDAVLALASGIRADNVEQYHDANCFLVASSVTDKNERIIPLRVHNLKTRIEAM